MKYEDGYVAYINGTRVSRDNLRDNNFTWDATARNQGVEEAMEFEEVDISRYKTVLVQGTNVLALRVLNSSRSSREMLLLPELVLRTVHIERNPAATVYYTYYIN